MSCSSRRSGKALATIAHTLPASSLSTQHGLQAEANGLSCREAGGLYIRYW